MELENLVDRARGSSPFVLTLSYGGLLTLANLVSTLAPKSALLALLAVLVWFAAALSVFVVVTWFRQDNWLKAGFIMGLTPVVARSIADAIAHPDVFASLGTSTGLLLRAIIAVPVCGGVVFGARWLTALIQGADASTSRARRS